NPDKVRPIPGGSKSCALNSLDIALTLDDQVHVRAPKLRKNPNREKRHTAKRPNDGTGPNKPKVEPVVAV
ncbi:MAG: hypothetical protein ABSD75_32675, partial [Terriglobales bacterium]